MSGTTIFYEWYSTHPILLRVFQTSPLALLISETKIPSKIENFVWSLSLQIWNTDGLDQIFEAFRSSISFIFLLWLLVFCKAVDMILLVRLIFGSIVHKLFLELIRWLWQYTSIRVYSSRNSLVSPKAPYRSLPCFQPIHEPVLSVDCLPSTMVTYYPSKSCKHMGSTHIYICCISNKRRLGWL